MYVFAYVCSNLFSKNLAMLMAASQNPVQLGIYVFYVLMYICKSSMYVRTMPLHAHTYVCTYVCTVMHLIAYVHTETFNTVHTHDINLPFMYVCTYVRMQCTNLAGLLHSLPPLGLYDPVPSQPHLGQQTVLVVFEGNLGHKALPLFINVLKLPLAEGVLQTHLAFLQTERNHVRTYIGRHQEKLIETNA